MDYYRDDSDMHYDLNYDMFLQYIFIYNFVVFYVLQSLEPPKTAYHRIVVFFRCRESIPWNAM